ncbi:hypothetical protein RJJ65_34100 [Rhizobium hidalgonense]|uniref:Uncharacterized protein n=1 Tax=Rhizobium hidalgonense TaxID=1538159 RepID=A0AAJ2GYZ9_9HYPH|nr:hypothetical protein [Rhizobium hidalgonense]MDR9777576.1 hypothetical protein [Rhizobium hidalgonense]
MSPRIVPYECPESLLSARQIGSFDLCQIRLLGQRKSNAVGRYADSSEDTEQDQQQKGCDQERDETPPASLRQIDAEGACDGD